MAPRPPVVAFGSLKGGVGKTTAALCAAELLRNPVAWPKSVLGTPYPVVFVDADVVGTEVALIWKAYTEASSSVQQIVADHPEGKVLDAFLESLPDPATAGQGFLVPSFDQGTSGNERRAWANVFERTATVVIRERLRDLIMRVRDRGYAVVIDLPAFDVGFADHARDAVLRTKDRPDDRVRVFTVTDNDIRSAFAVSGGTADWSDVVINRCQPGFAARNYFDALTTALRQPALTTDVSGVVVMFDTRKLLEASTVPSSTSLAAAMTDLSEVIPDVQHARRLRGEP